MGEERSSGSARMSRSDSKSRSFICIRGVLGSLEEQELSVEMLSLLRLRFTDRGGRSGEMESGDWQRCSSSSSEEKIRGRFVERLEVEEPY